MINSSIHVQTERISYAQRSEEHNDRRILSIVIIGIQHKYKAMYKNISIIFHQYVLPNVVRDNVSKKVCFQIFGALIG